MINIGSFRELIEIQESKIIIDENGFEVNKWITIGKKRSCVKVPSLRKQEIFKNNGVEITSKIEFTFRYFKGLTHNHRILWDGNAWDIKGIENPDNRKLYHQLLCERVI